MAIKLKNNTLYIEVEDHQGFVDTYLFNASQQTLDFLDTQLKNQKSKKRALYETIKHLLYVLEDSIGRGKCNADVLHDAQFLVNVLKKPCLSGHKITQIRNLVKEVNNELLHTICG